MVEFFVSRHFEFQLPEQVPTDVVPRGNFSGSEKRATEYYSWVPEDDDFVAFWKLKSNILVSFPHSLKIKHQ